MLLSSRGDGQMIHSLANRVASVFVAYGESSEENADIYAYAAEAIIAFLVNLAICLMIAFVFGRLLEGLVFILGFAVLRRHTGGYHANTHLKCILTFNCIVLCTMAILTVSVWGGFSGLMSIVIATLSVTGIFAAKVIERVLKISNETITRKLSKSGVGVVVGFWLFCVVAFYINNSQIGLVLALSMFFVFGSVAYAIYINAVSYSTARGGDE